MPTRLVEIRATELPTAEATAKVASELAEAIEAGGSFQTLVWMPQATERARGPQATRSVRMLKDIRPGLVEHCTGLAFVADEVTKAARGRSADAEARLWGCPVTTVTSEDEARAWLSARAESSGR